MFNYKKLMGDSAIFAIGNLGSKLVGFILIPFYTYFLTTSDYGIVDIITISINLLLPIVSLSVFDAVLRYGVDNKNDRSEVFSNGLFITLTTNFIGLLSYPVLKYFNVFNEYLMYIYIILCLKSIQVLMAQFVRSIDEIKIFSLNGILMSIVIGVSNIVLLGTFKLGIVGYLISLIIGQLFSILFLVVFAKLHNYIVLKRLNKSIIIAMLNYSIPLIPNTVSLWVTNASSQYFIIFFVSAGASGIFAVANRIPSLITMINSIFFQAWQLSAIKEFESKNKSEVYTDVFYYFSMAMFTSTSIILAILKPLLRIIVSDSFFTAWKYVPFLLLAAVFSSFSSFLGTNYIAAQETKGVLKTTLIMAVVSTILNFLLIPQLRIQGAGLSMMISYLILWIIRIKDTKKYVEIKLNFKHIILNLIIILFQVIFLNSNNESYLNTSMQLLLFLLIIWINRRFFNFLKPIFMKE